MTLNYAANKNWFNNIKNAHEMINCLKQILNSRSSTTAKSVPTFALNSYASPLE